MKDTGGSGISLIFGIFVLTVLAYFSVRFIIYAIKFLFKKRKINDRRHKK